MSIEVGMKVEGVLEYHQDAQANKLRGICLTSTHAPRPISSECHASTSPNPILCSSISRS